MKKFIALCLVGLYAQSAFSLEKEERIMPQGGIDKALLGQILFFDTSLSINSLQSCATCHKADDAFVDLRENSIDKMVSQGADPSKFGKRNAPTMLYAKFSPEFHYDEKVQDYVGGQFWDGRAKHLAEQAGGPPIDPAEMGMPDKRSVAERLLYNPMYFQTFSKIYGEQVWQSVDSVYAAMEDALATFQTDKKLLAPFDSKYDKFLKSEAKLTALEEQGRQLFFDKNKTNCSNCHQLHEDNRHAEETFTNYRYYNIAVPKNKRLISHNNLPQDFIDNGLLDNPLVKGDINQKGKFKVPTLRNVAVTPPYMHNGVFKELKTVLIYLNHFNEPDYNKKSQTEQKWEQPEYAATINHEELKAPFLEPEEIDALVAFLETLTDERYLPLLRKIKQQNGQ